MVSSLTRLGWYSGLWYSQKAQGHLGTSAPDMLHCLSHWPPWVPMLTCSLSSPVEQRFSHFSPNPYKMSPREHHLSSRLKTMRWKMPLTSEAREWLISQHRGILFSWTFPLSLSHQELFLALDPARHSTPGHSPLALDLMSICSSTYQSLLTGTWKTLPGRRHQVLGEVSPSSRTLVLKPTLLNMSCWIIPPMHFLYNQGSVSHT